MRGLYILIKFYMLDTMTGAGNLKDEKINEGLDYYMKGLKSIL